MIKKITTALFFFFSFLAPSFADTTYSYQGNFFNSFSVPPGSYDISDRVTGSFTVAAPLAGNLSVADISGQVLSFNFTDGVRTFTNSNAVICATDNYGFRVGTDSSGNINSWGITLCSSVSQVSDPVDFVLSVSGVNEITEDIGVSSGKCSQLANGVCTSIDIGAYGPQVSGATNGVILNSPGVWSTFQSTRSVPTMSEWGLIIFMIFAGALAVYYLKRQNRSTS